MILTACLAHAEAMATIHAAAFAKPDRWDAGAMATLLGSPGIFGLIHPGGGVLLARVVADEAEVLTVAVLPRSQRTGLGARLLKQAMAVAEGAGARVVFLEVAPDNRAAMALYGAAGFAECGRRRAYYADGSDALILRKALTCVRATAE